MTYGRIDSDQGETIAKIVRGQVVIDLGCGDGGWAKFICGCGPKKVIALDKQVPQHKSDPPDQIVWTEKLFEDYLADGPEHYDIAFLSWPVNRRIPALQVLVDRAKIVIYLGKNTDGTSCGWAGLFDALSQRAVRFYEPRRANTLIVYGEKTSDARQPFGEEIAARFYSQPGSRMLMYDEAERMANEASAVDRLAWRGV
jgi:hypothetical protein